MKAFFLVLSVVVLLTGCAHHSTDNAHDPQPVLRYESTNLEGRLREVEVMTHLTGDLLSVQVTLENPSAFKASYSYKFRWLDASGREIAPEGEPWTPTQLPARSQTRVQGVAPHPSATTFELWVRH